MVISFDPANTTKMAAENKAAYLAGYNKADYADNLDLFHTMEAYFTWYPNGVG